MKLFVTGAAGLVGAEVARYLRNRGHQVTGIDREFAGDGDAASSLSLDMARDDLCRALPFADVDALVHCAAVFPAAFGGEEDRNCAGINRRIDDNVMRFAEKARCRMVFMSSTSVYRQTPGLKVEESALQPDGYYAEEKLQSESLFLDRLSGSLIFRLNAPYGPGQRTGTVLKLFVGKAVRGEVLQYHGNGSRTQTFTHCSDIAGAVEAGLSFGDANGVFNIAGDQEVSMRALAELVVARMQGATPCWVAPSGKPDPQEGCRSEIGIEKAKSRLAWMPRVALADGVSEWLAFEMGDAGK